MRRWLPLGLALIVLLGASAQAWEKRAFKTRDDFGMAPLQYSYLQYYYYVPCPTYSWFWGFFGWAQGDKVGQFFTIGDTPTAGFPACDPTLCHDVVGFRILDFSGYGQVYPGLYTVKFNIYCCDATGCPVGEPLWESGSIETVPDWNTVMLDSALYVTACCTQPMPPAYPRILLTATHIGSDCDFPQWGMDNVSAPALLSCTMHDAGCLAALYPRPSSSHYTTIHSGYYGIDFANCPPIWFVDGGDTTPDGDVYGYLEFAWRLILECTGPHEATEPTSWGAIKAMYK
jgi:hypothetical protein